MRFIWILVCASLLSGMQPAAAGEVDFGDRQSRTLINYAWKSLDEKDYSAVISYAEKCLELYGDEAARMQGGLTDYPSGSNEDIFKYWALNDVATILFIQGEAFRKADDAAKARLAYQRIRDEFSYGQAWDPQGFFWKPAEAAKEKLFVLTSMPQLDYGDYSSAHLTGAAWRAYKAEDFAAAKMYVNKVVELYATQARTMQTGLDAFPKGDQQTINRDYWALNDVGTSYYIRGKIYRQQDKPLAARAAFQTIINDYSFAQWFDPSGEGSFVRVVEAAREELNSL